MDPAVTKDPRGRAPAGDLILETPFMHAPARPLGRQRQIASLTAAISAITMVGVGLSLSIPLLALEMAQRGISNKWMGINTAVAGIATVVAAPFIPALVRHVGTRTLLLLSIAVAALALPGFKATGFVWWFPLRFAFGAALCALFVVSEFWINAAAPHHRRGLVMGIYATALSIGAATGPAILGYLGSAGWAPYLAGSALLALGAIPVLLAGNAAPRIDHGGGRSILHFLRLSPVALLAALVFGAIETSILNFMPLYGMRLGMSEISATLLLTTAVAGNIAFQIPLGLISDRMDRRTLLALCAALGALGSLVLPFMPVDQVGFFVVVFLATGVVGSLYTVGLAYLGASFHGADLAAANAAFVMCYSIGLIIGPPAAGLAMDVYNPYGFAFAIAVMLGAYAVLAAASLLARRARDTAAPT